MNEQANFAFSSAPMPQGFTFGREPTPPPTLTKTQKQTALRNELKEKVENLEKENVRLRIQIAEKEVQLANKDEKIREDQITVFNKIKIANKLEAGNQKIRNEMEQKEQEIEDLGAKVQRLEDELESEQEARERAEAAWEDVNKELEAAKQKTREAEVKVAAANATIAQHEATIEAQGDQIAAADTEAEEYKTTISSLETKLATSKASLEAESAKTSREKELADSRSRDNAGISKMLTDKTKECEDITKECDDLRALERTRQQTEADLQDARDKNAALEDQISKLKTDIERRPFDVRPTAYTIPNPVAGEPVPTTPTLDDELAGVGGSSTSSERALSEHGSEDEHAISPTTAGEDDTLKLGKDESSPYQQPPTPEPAIQIQTRTIFTPFQVSAHNPLLCWIQIELNFLILFSVWLTWFLGRASSFLRRRLRYPRRLVYPADDFDLSPFDDFKVPPTNDFDVPGGPRDAPTFDLKAGLATVELQAETERRMREASELLPPLEEQPDYTDVFGDPLPPVEDSVMPSMYVNAGGEVAADTTAFWGATMSNAQNRPWYAKIISPQPGDIPSVSKTLCGLAFHLIIYYCIGIGYLCYRERNLWLDANDRTRTFLLQLLRNPHGYQSLIHRLAYPLPEHWKHSIDVFIFKYFVEKLGLHANIAMPG